MTLQNLIELWPKTNKQAEEQDINLQKISPEVYSLLSFKGLQICYPSSGILKQGAEAEKTDINATVGFAFEEDEKIMFLPSVQKNNALPPEESYRYAPSFGLKKLREKWAELLPVKNPSLKNKSFSLPIVTSALTHGLRLIGEFFVNPGDKIICTDLFWGNYRLILENGCGGNFDLFPTFRDGTFNLVGLREKLLSAGEKKLLLLNFPNNPSGYTPTKKEAEEIVKIILEAADSGKKIAVILDDSYFGLVYEEGIIQESLFPVLCDLHKNVLAIKVDGPTKEDYVWGFRTGFLTYGIKNGNKELYAILEDKTAGLVRGMISNCSHLAQSILLRAYSDPQYFEQKKEKFAILQKRYQAVKKILAAHPEYLEYFVALPFNSGYFMCVKPLKADAEKLRQQLLQNYSTGLIQTNGVLRIAFSCVPLAKMEKLFNNIFRACQDLLNK